jgi:hypothetical protein
MSPIRDRPDISYVSQMYRRSEGVLNAKKEQLDLPAGREGKVVYHEYQGVALSPHRHEQLEVNLVVRGSATYLLGTGVTIWERVL